MKKILLILMLFLLPSFAYATITDSSEIMSWYACENDLTSETGSNNGNDQGAMSFDSVDFINGAFACGDGAWSVTDSFSVPLGGFVGTDTNTSGCISMWFRDEADGTDVIMSHENSGRSSQEGHFMRTNAGTSMLYQSQTLGWNFNDATDIVINTWDHLVWDWNSTGDMTIWRNGVRVTIQTFEVGQNNIGELFFGSQQGGNIFTGQMDDIMFSNVSCSSTNIVDLYNSGASIDYSDFLITLIPPSEEPIISFQNATPSNGTVNNTQALIEMNATFNGNIYLFFDDTNPPTTPIFINESHTDGLSWTTNVTTSGTYYYYAQAYDVDTGTITSNTTIREWIYDVEEPPQTLNPSNGFNAFNQTTNTYANILPLNITITDNRDLFGLQINLSAMNGSQHFIYTNESLSGTSFTYTNNIDVSGWADGLYLTEIISSDSHTEEEIDEYEHSIFGNKIIYDTAEGNRIVIQSQGTATVTTEKLLDSYTFTFDFTGSPSPTKIFFLECDNILSYRPESEYTGHFTCWNPSAKNGNWVDWIIEGEEELKPTIEIVEPEEGEPTKYKITYHTNSNILKFKSIGGLNVNIKNYLFTKSSLTLNSVEIEPAFPFDTSDLLGYANATEGTGKEVRYDFIWYNNGVLFSNGSTANQTSNSRILIDTISSASTNAGDNWTFSIRVNTDGNSTEYVNSSSVGLYRNLTINVFDRQTENLILSNVSLNIPTFGNFTTDTGTIFIGDFPASVGPWTLQASTEGYLTNQISFTLSETEESVIDIFLINVTGDNLGALIIVVSDDFFNLIEGANTKLLEYNAGLDSFIEVAQCFTNSNGECIFNIELGTKFYIVTTSKVINGQLLSGQSTQTGELIQLDNTILSILLKTSQSFQVDPDFDLVLQVTNTSLVGNTSFLTVTFDDPENNEHTVCVEYFFRNGRSLNELDSSCVTATAGIVNYAGGFILDRSVDNIAQVYTITNGIKKVYDTYEYPSITSFQDTFDPWVDWLIFAILLGLLSLAVYLKNINIFALGTMIFSPLSLIINPNWIGLTSISFILVMGGCIMYFSSKKREF